MMTRVSGERPSSWNAWVSAWISSALSALWTSGRDSVTVATAPWWVICKEVDMDQPALHSEDACAAFGQRRVQGGGDAEGEHHPGVERVDHAVVPETGGAVV